MEDLPASFHRSPPAPPAPSFARSPSAVSVSSVSSASSVSSSSRKPPRAPALSVSTLRYPTPEGSSLLAQLVTASSCPDTMDVTPPFGVSDETCSLAGSAYELISSTDGESQDGRGSESVADSLDVYPRVDDVHSLSGNDAAYDDDDASASEDDNDATHHPTHTTSTPSHSFLCHGRRGADDEDGAGRRSSQADSIQYTEHVLANPSTQSLSTLDYDSSADGLQSIEFSESGHHADRVSVKHTIRDFSEAESAAIAADMHLVDPPKRLAATIRQTMSHYCLSTREPLRVLYVGSDAGYSEIMHKISSALLASAPRSRSGAGPERHGATPSVYNIMPISAFGSSKVPQIDEIQLMGVSDYYIEVDHCVSAEQTPGEAAGEAFAGDATLSITLENDKTYRSVASPKGVTVCPEWTLPHVAIFYVSGNDDSQAEATRNAAWEFMTRHAVPSIFVTHKQSFLRPASLGRWPDFVDQAAVHLCLESRGSDRPSILERLPIDLESFMNIDARQMNRNLAYLTGLHEAPESASASPVAHPAELGYLAVFAEALRLLYGRLFGSSKTVRAEEQPWKQPARSDRASVYAFCAIGTLILSACVGMELFSNGQGITSSATSTSALASTMASSTSTLYSVGAGRSALAATTAPSSLCSVPALTPTVTISLVSTKTIKLPASETTSSADRFGGFLTDGRDQKSASSSESEIKSTGCSIHVYSTHELLVKVPAGTKTTWLAKGAIDIDVWRGQQLLKSRLSTSDEGIIIEINKKDAYGVMNVSIVTTRRPKINETFAVDFGTPTMSRLLEAGNSLWQDGLHTVRDASTYLTAFAGGKLHEYADQAAETASHATMPWSVWEAMANASSRAQAVASSVTGKVAESFEADGWVARHSASAAEPLKSGLHTLFGRAGLEAREALGQATAMGSAAARDARLSVIQAQIASKLWWLRVQGKLEEHAAYAAKAEGFLREKQQELAKAGLSGASSSSQGQQGRGPQRWLARLPSPWRTMSGSRSA